MPLGIMPEIEYDETHLTLTPGDIVILYSDGVTEAIGSGDCIYGMDTLRDLISTLQLNLSAQSMVEKIIESVRVFAGDRPQSDNMTVIAICVKE
jgi:sigma-B regulation protein RsbU (phosphoserine phosphatase)